MFQKINSSKIISIFCIFQILMMVLPLLLIMILPKMMNDPETRKARIFFIGYNVYNVYLLSQTCYHRSIHVII